MPRLTNDNPHGLSSIGRAPTVVNSPAINTNDGGAFDLLLKQVATTADRPDRTSEDVSQAKRTESDTRPADEQAPAAESNENELRPDDSQQSDEAPSARSDPPEQAEQEQGQEQCQEPEQDQEQGQEQKQEKTIDAGVGDGSEISETENDPDQPVESEEDEDAEVQVASQPRQVLVEAVAQQTDADETNVAKASAEDEPLQPDRENQAATKTERRAGTAAKIDVSADASGESNGEQGETAKENDAPVVELTTDDSEKTFTARQSGDPTETGGQPSGIEPLASAVKAPQTVEKPSRRERRHGADQAAATEPMAETLPAVQARGGPDPGTEILAALSDPAKTATDEGGTETVESGPKPVADVINQGETGQTARGSSAEGPRAVSAGEAAAGSETDSIDRVRFVQRVARAFEAATSRNGSIRMRLHPAELGSLRLEITVRNGVMTARLETETQTARNLLLDNLPALRERLAQQDIKVQQFDIDLMDNSTGGSPRGPEDESFSQDRSGQQGSGTAAEQSAEAEDAPRPAPVTRPGEGIHLNVVI